MPQARGTQTTIALYDEATYGVDPGSPVGVKLYVVSSTLAQKQTLLTSQSISSGRGSARPARGNIDVTGSIEVEISAENMPKLIKNALGTNSTTGVGPYVHQATIGALPVGLMVEHDYGSNISGVGRYEKFNGVRIADMTLNFPTEGYCTATFSVIGAKSTLASAPLDATLTDNFHKPFSSFQATITEGGSAIATVTTAQVKINNGLDTSSYVIGGAGVRRALVEGECEITGTLTALFEDATLLNKAVNDTTTSLKITLARGDGLGSSNNESFETWVTNMVYERTSPAISGPKGILQQFAFRGFLVSADLGITITTKNTTAVI